VFKLYLQKARFCGISKNRPISEGLFDGLLLIIA